VRLAVLLIDSDAVAALTALVFCLGGVPFYTLLYRSGIARRWIAVWGLLGTPCYAAAYLLAMSPSARVMQVALPAPRPA